MQAGGPEERSQSSLRDHSWDQRGHRLICLQLFNAALLNALEDYQSNNPRQSTSNNPQEICTILQGTR